jgi:hypothetical protein
MVTALLMERKSWKNLLKCSHTNSVPDGLQNIYSIVSAVQRQLSWTHLKTLSYEKEALKREFYLEMAIHQRWNTRTLIEQVDKMLYERTAIATKPQEQIEQAIKQLKEDNTINPELVFKSSPISHRTPLTKPGLPKKCTGHLKMQK